MRRTAEKVEHDCQETDVCHLHLTVNTNKVYAGALAESLMRAEFEAGLARCLCMRARGPHWPLPHTGIPVGGAGVLQSSSGTTQKGKSEPGTEWTVANYVLGPTEELGAVIGRGPRTGREISSALVLSVTWILLLIQTWQG